MNSCMGQKGDRDEAAAGCTASARPPIPGAAAPPPPTSDHALRPLTLAQPLCVPLHTRAAGHLGALRPRCHVLGRPIQQQRVVEQSSWAGVTVGTKGDMLSVACLAL